MTVHCFVFYYFLSFVAELSVIRNLDFTFNKTFCKEALSYPWNKNRESKRFSWGYWLGVLKIFVAFINSQFKTEKCDANACKLVEIKFCTACNKILLLVLLLLFFIKTSTPAMHIETSDLPLSGQEPFFTVNFTHLHNTFIKCESAAILAYRLFARPSHMVQNYIYWWASYAVGLPKQRQVHCFGSPTAQLAHQHVWFRTMRPDRAKGLFWSICRDGGARKYIIEAIYMVKLSFQAFSSVWLSSLQ